VITSSRLQWNAALKEASEEAENSTPHTQGDSCRCHTPTADVVVLFRILVV